MRWDVRGDVLEYALQRVAGNKGGPGVDGQTIASITASPEGKSQWLQALQEELKTRTYRPSPVRWVFMPKSNGGQRPLGISTVQDRVLPVAATLVLMPILEADFHPRSFGFRPRRKATKPAKKSCAPRAVDAPKCWRRTCRNTSTPSRTGNCCGCWRVSDDRVWRLIKRWLRAPVVAEDKDGTRRMKPNRSGPPQGGGISPWLANFYRNGLDWAVNEKVRGQPVLVRYADNPVSLSAPGKGKGLRERLRKWLTARGLSLNEEKTRLVDSREGFNFLGFTVRWQRGRGKQDRWDGHVEPSAQSRQRLRETVRPILHHGTQWKSICAAVEELNPVLRGWSGYDHFRHSRRARWETQDGCGRSSRDGSGASTEEAKANGEATLMWSGTGDMDGG